MSQRHSEYKRQPDELYETPPWVTRCIVPWLKHYGLQYVWEPAPGSRKMVNELRRLGFDVSYHAKQDFLTAESPRGRDPGLDPGCNPEIDAICTNPPYGKGGKLAEQFIEHALILSDSVAMLLRVDFDSGKTRQHLFGGNPAFSHKIVLLDRIMWFEGSVGPSTNHAWFCWRRTHQGRPTISYAGKNDDRKKV